MRIAIAIMIGLALAGCSSTNTVTETRIVEVPSSAPYRFISYEPADSAQTKREVRAHNRAHQAVIDAERKVRSQ